MVSLVRLFSQLPSTEGSVILLQSFIRVRDRQIGIGRETDRHTSRQRDRQRHRQRDKQRGRQRGRQRHRQRGRQIGRQRDRQRGSYEVVQNRNKNCRGYTEYDDICTLRLNAENYQVSEKVLVIRGNLFFRSQAHLWYCLSSLTHSLTSSLPPSLRQEFNSKYIFLI